MSWKEFSVLVSGLGKDTPLANIIAIRSETDGEVIKKMTREQKAIRTEWHRRLFDKKTKEEQDREVQEVIQGLLTMVGVDNARG